MSLLYLKLLLFVPALAASALFAFMETVVTGLRLYKVRELATATQRYKHLFEVWEHNPRQLLVAILIVCNLFHVLASVLIADIIQGLLGDTGISLLIGVVSATAVMLLFGEIIPKSYAKSSHQPPMELLLWVLSLLFNLLGPLVRGLLLLADYLVAAISGNQVSSVSADKKAAVSEKEIEFLISYGDKMGVIAASKSEMLRNVFNLGSIAVKEIMVPGPDIIAINIDASLEDAMTLSSTYLYTRLPVYEGKEDNIIGLVHQKMVFDAIYQHKQVQLRDIVMPIWFAPEVQRVDALLSDLLKRRIHMAVAVDEYGSIKGLVTVEDIIEEIVGEINDEYEHDQHGIVSLDEGGWMVDGRVELKKLHELLSIAFDTRDSVTIAGFVTEKLQHVPRKGERVWYAGYCFQIHRASATRVFQILVFEEKGIGSSHYQQSSAAL